MIKADKMHNIVVAEWIIYSVAFICSLPYKDKEQMYIAMIIIPSAPIPHLI